jgi:hypothetical protein
MATQRPDPVDVMLDICSHFVGQAEELDQRAQAAIDSDAGQVEIVSLLNLSATNRMRALAAAQAAAPFVRPRLQAVEISPVTTTTRDRFAQRLERMTEQEIEDQLRAIAAGQKVIEFVEDDDDL